MKSPPRGTIESLDAVVIGPRRPREARRRGIGIVPAFGLVEIRTGVRFACPPGASRDSRRAAELSRGNGVGRKR